MQGNSLIRKLRLISKFITSQTDQQIIAIHILPITSRSISNQTMKFGQLIEYNLRNIFLEQSYAKCGGGANPSVVYKKIKNEHILDQWSKIL